MSGALTRRAALVGGAALAAPLPANAALPRLKDLAAKIGLPLGTDSDADIAGAPAAYAAIITAHCNQFAPNLGWRRVAAKPGAAEPDWEDPNVAVVRQWGQLLTGAHLLWHESIPAWFAALGPGDTARQAAASHITQMVRHYRGQIFSWNVVNEEIDTFTGDADGMRRSALCAQLGHDFIAQAFKVAAAANSGALLTYNDNNLEMDTQYHANRRSALLRLLDRLQRAGAPITAVGLQSHLRLDETRFDAALYRRFLHDIAARGLRILITELDVSDVAFGGSVAQRDRAVADMYSAFLDVALDEPAVAQLVLWGMSDRYTWLTPNTDMKYLRADGLPARPCPFDDAFKPKAAFTAIAAALRAAPARKSV